MGFEEEAAVFPTENVFRESFLVIFCLYVAWDEKSYERIPSGWTARREGRQLLALHVCRRIRRMIDGRAETKMRTLCLATWSDPMFIFVYELFSLAPVAPRSYVRAYECISRPRQQHPPLWHGVRSQRDLILDGMEWISEADKVDRQPGFREGLDLILLTDA